MDLCKSCGEKSLETVDHFGEQEYVCTLCGTVQEKGSFCTAEAEDTSRYVTNNRTLFNNQAAPTAIQVESYTARSVGWKSGNLVIAELTAAFRLTHVMKQEVSDLFEKAISHKNTYMVRVEQKRMFAASCVYIVMRQHNWPVTVSNICSTVGCNKEDLSRPLRTLVKLFDISITTTPIEELVEGFVKECKALDSSEKEEVMSRVFKILQLAKECWLVEGRTPRPILIVSIYLAWQSLDLTRNKISCNSFCRKMGFTCPVNINSRRKEIVKVLCSMGSAIPWFEANFITPKNLSVHLQEILTYPNALVENVGCDARIVIPSRKKVEVQPQVYSHDFTEEEIDSYIRTEEEVKLLKGIKNVFPN